MGRHSAGPVDLAPPPKSSPWWFEWQTKTVTGIPANPGRVFESGILPRTRYGCQHPPEARDRAGSRAETEDDVEGVPAAPLGTDRRRRLLYHRGLDSPRPTALDRVIFHRVVHPESRDRRDC